MEDGGANNVTRLDCADRINKFEEQQPSRVDAEKRRRRAHTKGQVGAADKVAKLDIQIVYAGTGTLLLQLLYASSIFIIKLLLLPLRNDFQC